MSNHIDHIEITNFKSIRHQKIEGCKRINVFIGYPNVGKSNILEALSLFSLPYLKIARSKKLTNFIRVKNLPELFYNTNTEHEQPIDISINSNIHLWGHLFSNAYYPLELLYFGLPIIDEEFKIHFNNDLKAKFENLPKDIKATLPFDILKYDFSVSNSRPQKTLYPSLIPPYGDNIFEIINKNSELSEFVKNELAKIGGEYVYDTSDNSGKIFKESNNKKFSLPYSSMADTLQRLIFYMAAIVSNKNSILLFEEPEAHMFPPYVSKLTADVIYEKENGNQYFIATHSPFVLNDFIEDAKGELSIYAVGLHNGETTIKRITEDEMHEIYQYGIDLFFNLEDYLKND